MVERSESMPDERAPASRTAIGPGGAKPPRIKARRPRGSLSQKEILDGAHRLIERDGLEGLSMPALAKHLGSGVTSIYWYFRSKDELLTALTDQVSREMYRRLPPIGDGPWHEEIFNYFAAFRDLIRSEPVYREVFIYRVRFLFLHAAMAPGMLRRLEAGLQVFVRGGLTAEQAIDAMNICSSYTRGFVVLEHAMESDAPHESGVTRLDDDSVSRALLDFNEVAWLDDTQFRLGLRLLIEGIRARVESAATA